LSGKEVNGGKRWLISRRGRWKRVHQGDRKGGGQTKNSIRKITPFFYLRGRGRSALDYPFERVRNLRH